MQEKTVIGIDIGGTTTKYGLVNTQGEIITQGRMPTDVYNTPDEFINELHYQIISMLEPFCNIQDVKGIGIGAPDSNYYTGTIEHATNLKWKGIIPFAKMVSAKFNIPVKLTNDANAAAMGELKYGCARGMKHFIMITLGTGVGSGVVIDGKIVLGHDGFAAELGQTVIRPNGRPMQGSDVRGTLEAYLSAEGIKQTALELLHENKGSLLNDYVNKDNFSSETIYQCAKKGDAIACEVFNISGRILGEALANFVMFSSPQAIILFGGIAKSFDLLQPSVQQAMGKNLLQVYRNKVQLLPSQLNEADAAILGASALITD